MVIPHLRRGTLLDGVWEEPFSIKHLKQWLEEIQTNWQMERVANLR